MEAQLPKMSFNNEATTTGSLNNRVRATRIASGGRTSSLHLRHRDVSAASTLSKMSAKNTDDTPAALGASITIGTASDQDTPVTQYAMVPNEVQDVQVSPTRVRSPRVLPLAAINNGIRLSDGAVVDVQKLIPMADELEAAREDRRFPNTTASYTNAQAVLDDYEHLIALQQHTPGSQQYNTLFVENARRIQDRDSQVVHDNHDAHVRNTVQNLLRNQDVGEDLNSLVRHAARTASANAVERALANNQQLAHADLVRDVSQAVIHTLADQGLVGGHSVEAVDDILEDMFGTVEATVLDATGPLRMNVRNLRDTNNDIRDANQEHRAANDNLGNHLDNLSTQVGAINTHVGAVSAHVNVLGSLAQVINSTATRTNAQVGQVSSDLHALQQITAMLPSLIQEIVQQILPGAVQAALTQVLAGSLLNANGKLPFMVAAQTVASSQTELTTEKNNKDSKKSKKRGFFARLFKRGGKKDGENGAAN
ncbi:hypothetical protein E8E14_014360 [Neopestalotiopsis sp. 37M]|nr:hypothetical protein E8E14_014360 [Neopestalotiopsis sp. 37M]